MKVVQGTTGLGIIGVIKGNGLIRVRLFIPLVENKTKV